MISIRFLGCCSSPTLQFAAEELLHHLQIILPGIALSDSEDAYPVGFHVQPERFPCCASPELDDAYIWNVTDTFAEFIADNPRSILLAVYRYLREIGFRFISPVKAGTIAPSPVSGNAFLPLSSGEQIFKLRHRGVCIEGSESIENTLDFISWMPKLGYNTFFVQFFRPDIFFKRWYTRENNIAAKGYTPSEAEFAAFDKNIREALSLRSLLHQRVGHGWTGKAVGEAAIGWDQAQSAPSDEIRSLLAEVSGKREFFNGIPSDTHLCYSNPEAVRRLVAAVTEYAVANPDIQLLHFWLADEPNNVCECPKCRKTTLSDQYIQILNALDASLTKVGSSVRIIFLLYQELLYPPRNEKLLNPDRFVLMFAPISRTFERSYSEASGDIDSQPLDPYIRNRFHLPVDLTQNLSALRQWQRIFPGDSFIYDYPLGRAHYGDFGYMKISRIICEDIAAVSSVLGLNGYVSCQELRALCPSAFPNYCMGLMLESPARCYEALRDEYFSAAFRSNAPFVIHYLEELSRLSDTDYINGKCDTISPCFHEKLSEIKKILEMQPISGDDYFSDLLRYHNEYTYVLVNALLHITAGETEAAAGEYKAFLNIISQNEDRFQPELDVYRICEVLGRYTGFCRLSSAASPGTPN